MLLKRSLSTSYTARGSRNTVTLSWDLVMSNMECCGVNNYTDFLEASQFVAASSEEGVGRKVKALLSFMVFIILPMQVPEACCILQGDHSLLQPADENCVVSPSTTNSYLFKVTTSIQYFLTRISRWISFHSRLLETGLTRYFIPILYHFRDATTSFSTWCQKI